MVKGDACGWRDRWPAIRSSWVLHADDALVSVNKPEGVGGPGSDAPEAATLEGRWAKHVSAEGGGRSCARLGVHHHVGRDASGVMVFGQSREGNRGLAAQFEGRRVRAEMLVGVEGWPHGKSVRTLRLAPGKQSGKRRRARKGGRVPRPVEARAERVAHQGERSLIRVRMDTPNLGAVRGMFAQSGLAIAGDSDQGGAPAWRLMLHLSELRLDHPTTGEPLRLRSPQPPAFGAWLQHGGLGVPSVAGDELGCALDQAIQRR